MQKLGDGFPVETGDADLSGGDSGTSAVVSAMSASAAGSGAGGSGAGLRRVLMYRRNCAARQAGRELCCRQAGRCSAMGAGKSAGCGDKGHAGPGFAWSQGRLTAMWLCSPFCMCTDRDAFAVLLR